MVLNLEKYLSTSRIASSLLFAKVDGTHRAAAAENASRNELKPPLNTEFELLADLTEVIQKRIVSGHLVSFVPNPYWLENATYDPLEIFATTIQFFDNHSEPLPKTTLPPSKDIKEFIQYVLESSNKLDIRKQFEKLLNISRGNILGAANIAFLATRLLARGWETRAYPEIEINPGIIRKANQRLVGFEGYANSSNDTPGDTYYFWTHFFASSAYSQLGGGNADIFNGIFRVGTPLMQFARKYVARQPMIGEYNEASMLGRHIGLAIGEIARVLIL